MTFDKHFSVRCTGAEYVAFLTDDSIWPEGRFITQMVNRINGDWLEDRHRLSDIAPDAVIEISDEGGVADDDPKFTYVNIVTYFNQWRDVRERKLCH
jgi:hypothetical protein